MPGRKAGAAAKPGRPVISLPRQQVLASVLAHAWLDRRNPWHLRTFTSHRSRPPCGRRRAKPDLETVEKVVTDS